MASTETDWVEVRSCTWIHEAEFFRSLLGSAGIETLIPNEHTLGIQPFYAPALGGVRVLVARQDVGRAIELLNSASESGEDRREKR